MLRLLLVLVFAGACGRVGFDSERSGGDTGMIDGSVSDGNIVDGPPIDTPVGIACTDDSECGRCARCDGVCKTEPITDLFLGHRSMCYLGAGGTRWCAGENNDGALGLGDTTNRSTPTRPLPDDGGGWQRISLSFYGRAHATKGASFYEWGATQLTPVEIGPARPLRGVLGDLERECFWEQDGTAPMCPGSGANVWRSLDFGAGHYCGVRTDGTLWCWGVSYSGAIGVEVGDGVTFDTPRQVGTDTDWVQVGAGGRNAGPDPSIFTGSTCALKSTGQIFCFGHASLTGTNGTGVGATPTPISGATNWSWIDVDWEHACAGNTANEVWCWGADTYGGFVAVGLESAAVPTRIPGTYDRWVMGGHHACGLSAGRWRCFGWNTSGQLGVGTTTNDGQLVDLCP